MRVGTAQQLDDSARVLAALHEIAAGGAAEAEALARLAAERARELLEADVASLHYWDAEAGALQALYIASQTELPSSPVASGQGAVGLAFERHEPVVVGDYARWKEAPPDLVECGLRATIAVPLLLGERAIGTLAVGYRTAQQLTAEQVRVLTLLAALIAPTLEATRCYAEAERTREQARRETAQTSAILSQMADAVLVVDREGRVTLANPAASELFGLAVDRLVGLAPDAQPWVGYDAVGRQISPEEWPLVRALRGERGGGEYRVVGADGREHWVWSTAVPLRDSDGEIQGAVLVAHDVTARQTAAERAQQLVENEKLRALGQMASGVAHDLNQSLGMVVGHSELALRAVDQGGAKPADLRDSLNTVLRAAMDGADSVKRLLTFVRTAPEGEAEAAEVASVLREVAQLTAPRWRDAAQAEGRPISLHVEADGDTTIAASPASLREALTNLVFNAVDALPQGGLIRLSVRRRGDGVEVDVSDSGVGMSPEVQRRIFEPFFTTKGERGTGVGLSTVFAIVQRYGGKIEVQSAPGRGTTFRLRFPARVATEAASPAVEVSQPAVKPLRVLAVDDEPGLGRIVELMLAREGHRVEVVQSGESAVACLEQGEFDLVISDIGMGAGMNGWELAAIVRQRWPEVRFLLATGWGAAIDPDEARQRGVEAVIAKPYRLADLRKAIAGV
ncbi:MAG TPA: ATP-binding protein, partial [Chloroflexota bacterium]